MQFMTSVIPLIFGFVYLSRASERGKCQTSVSGIALIEHRFMVFNIDNIHLCYERCKEKIACQSITYYRTSSLCELNNRSITTNPDKKITDANAVYFEHPEPAVIGSHEETPAESCMEIKTTTNTLHSGLYWVKHALTRNISKIYCNMTTGVADGCVTSPCKNQGTCSNMKYGDYNCTCTASYKGVNCELEANDACKANPCLNKGTCSNSGVNDYSCACVAGYAGKSCDVISSSECSSYSNITDSTRRVDQVITAKACDSGLAIKWYRLTGAAGVRIPTSCTLKSRCNTDATGWLSGAQPTVQQGIVTVKVCFNWSTNCCSWSVNIRVRNCGPYYVYELQPSPACHLRYCGTN